MKTPSDTSATGKFCCPQCSTPVSWTEMLRFKKGHVTACEKCNAALVMSKPISFQWGFGLGFLGFVLPAQSVFFFLNQSLLAFLAGSVGALLTITAILIYLYKTVEFIKVN